MAHSHLWNDLPADERKRLWPHVIESHILHLTQARAKIVEAHESLMRDLDGQIGALHSDLSKEVAEQASAKRRLDLSERAAKFAAIMRCNCDLDNWEPEPSTGHSHVCRIHQAAIGQAA